MDALQPTLSVGKTKSADAREECAPSRATSTSWSYPPILSKIDAPPAERGVRPGAAGEGVLDAASFDAIEADSLFDAINHARTQIGRAILYRSLAKPPADGVLARNKQEALRELEANPGLEHSLISFVDALVSGEKGLYRLLYGRFVGGSFLSGANQNMGPLDFEGYGYEEYVEGTGFAVDMVERAAELPQPKSSYLRDLFDDIRDFGCSRTYALMKGPVYPVNGDFLTRAEKPRFLPAFRFIPSSVKPIPSLLGVAGLAATMYFSDSLLAGAGHMKYAMLILMLPVIPMIFSSIATSDRDTIIYPLRKKFKSSPELARSLDALGLIDELLAFRRYAQAFGNDVVLPEIIDNERHCLQAQQVRNPVLGKGNSAYVPNQIPIDAAGERLLVITGPNSGGKTAYCKTVAQVQLLGQIGCYVPAEKARLVPVEHIFYQVPDPGRLDEKMGRFGHELKRTREIFFNATSRSLVVLDELGEGTTYEEKMEISEYILKGFHSLGASTLLVTHNHELCQRLHEEAMGQYLQVEFAEGKPTHRLTSGVSKVSHADRVAAALGFSRDDVKKYLATRRIGEAA